MRGFYSLLLYLLVPFILLRLLLRSLGNPAYRYRIPERFGFFRARPQSGGTWIHAVSVGEAVAAVKLVRALKNDRQDQVLTVTCGTPTGSEIIRSQLGDSVFHVYVPYDLPGAVSRFLDRCRPKTAIIMETELWPNLFHQASRAGVHLLISNMRLSDRSYRRYGRIPGLVRETLGCVDGFAAQSEEDASRVVALGADPDKVEVVGNLKFELDGGGVDVRHTAALKERLATGRPVWLAGSTHEGEDLPVLETHVELLASHPELLLILVPRHPERFDSVFQLADARLNTQRRTRLADEEKLLAEIQVLLLDTIGELSRFIDICDWVFIGGSLVPVGGHNILEACQAGVPVIYGPHMENFREVAKIVSAGDAGLQLRDASELTAVCRDLLNDADRRERMGAAGLALMKKNRGALARTLSMIERVSG